MKFNRREFLQYSGLAAASLALGPAVSALSGCGYGLEWKPVSYPRVLLKNFRLFDGVTNGLKEGLAVLVEKGAIAAIERMADVEKLPGCEVIDLGGATLLPGLIDNHVHMTVPFMYSVNVDTLRQMNRQIVYNFRNCVVRGVTTVRDVGGFPGKINKFRLLADANEIPGPRVISSLSPIAARKGDMLGAPEKAPYFKNPVLKWLLGGNYAERPETVEEIREASERMVSLGAQWLKSLYQEHSYSYHPRSLPNHSDEGYRAIVEVGKRHGIKCALHEPFVGGFKKGVDLGFHTLDHMPMDELIPEKYIEKFMKRGMAMMPTLMAYGDTSLEEELLHLVETRGAEYLMPEAIKQMSARLKESIEQGKKKMTAEERKSLVFDRQYLIEKYPVQVKNLMRLHRMGAVVGAGTDLGGYYSGFFGRFVDELARYVGAGISTFDALRMATSVNARILDMQGKIGVVKKGAFADLIAVEGDPLKNVRALEAVRMVMKGGVFMKVFGNGGKDTAGEGEVG